ncbi:MAG: NUDIX domain-containing protein [Patescibacteria group bacterium]|nr:NUDIX domain-containing protein [Patescibacteria group bacterium]
MIENNKVGVGVGVMILKNNKILLGKRNQDPNKADSELHGEGTWTMPGGKLRFGESFTAGAEREVFEETGLKIKSVEVISLSNDIVKDAHFVTIGLLCRDFEGEAEIMEPEEIIEWRWFSLDQLPDLIFFPSEKVIKNYLAKKFFQDF